MIRTASINLTEPLMLKKNEGYLGILFYKENYAEDRLPNIFEKIEGINNVTPKGLSNTFTFNTSYEVKFGISLMTGKNCAGLIKALMLTRAFELENLLNKNPVVLNGIYSGI